MTDQWGRVPRSDFRAVTDPLADHERRLKRLEGFTPDQLGGTRQQIVVVEQKAETAQADAATAQAEALTAKADALEAAANALSAQADALQAALDAAAAQQQTVVLRESIAQPGVNKFDTAPIVAQNIAGYYTENLTGYSWITGGIRLQTPVATAVGVRVYTLDTFPVRPGDILSASVALTFDNPAVAGFGWSFFDADGAPISSSASSIATENGLLESQYQVPASAASLKMNLFAYVPNGYAVTRTWVNFQNPYVGILVGSDGLAKHAVERVNVAPGAIGPTELGSDVTLGVADNSLTTAKYQDASVTDVKIAGMALSKGTGTLATSQYGNGTVTPAKLDTYLQARVKPNGSFTRTGNDSQLYTNVNTITWTALGASAATNVTISNTLNDGTAASFSSSHVVLPATGDYDLRATLRFATSGAGTARSVAFQINSSGTMFDENAVRARSGQMFDAGGIVVKTDSMQRFNAGDVIQVMARHDAGVTIGVRIDKFSIKYLGQ